MTQREVEIAQLEQVKEQQAHTKRKFRYELLVLAQETHRLSGTLSKEGDADNLVIKTAEKYATFVNDFDSQSSPAGKGVLMKVE